MGAFPLDHDAKQEAFTLLRREGVDFARACSGKVLVLAEEPHFMMMSLIELDPTVRLTSFREADTNVIRADGTRCTADFVEKQAIRGHDTAQAFLASPLHEGWSIYFQEMRRNPYDTTPIPAERRFCIGGGSAESVAFYGSGACTIPVPPAK
jgi:hypothetical protein